MANINRFLISITLLFTIIFIVDVHSVPTNTTDDITPVPVVNTIPISDHMCFTDSDCNKHGRCDLNVSRCICERGYTTYDKVGDKRKYCAYEQRSKQTAFFLSLFVGLLGIDWFYLARSNLGYIIAGILKLLLGCGCCGSWPLAYFGPEIQNSESVKSKLRGVRTFFSLVAFAWWIVDWARILNNKFPDGNAAPLLPW